MRLPGLQRNTLARLIGIVERLRGESAGFQDEPGNQQLWYDRGYANGVLHTLVALGYGDQVAAAGMTADPGLDAAVEALAWGRAYRHGHEVAARDTREVLPPAPSTRGR